MQRVITLPAVGKSIPLGDYVKGIKLAKANPDATFKHGLTCWHPVKGKEIVRQFRDSIHDRINKHLDRPSGARTALLSVDRRIVEDYLFRRVRSTGARALLRTRYMQKRYPHINNQTGQ